MSLRAQKILVDVLARTHRRIDLYGKSFRNQKTPRAFLDRKECVCEVQRDRARRLRKVLFDRFMMEQVLKIMDKTDNIRDERDGARVT